MSALQGTSKIFTQDITKNLLRFDQSWSRWKLTNGLSCIHVPLPVDDIRLHVGLLVHTGSRWESPEKSGLSHLLEHMMFRGSSLYPSFFELSEAFEGLGGEWNAATGHEYTEYFYSGTVDKEHDAFRLLSDFTLRPALNDLDTEKRIVLRELEGELNEHGVSTDVDFHILRHLWPETSMALPIIGSEGTLEKIKLEDLRAWLA
ncbi:MAG: pitrilysin family protein, partial [Proteobacteria bacterium]|nr:pitrilysin family protein [Pseudomonadota bacterium]